MSLDEMVDQVLADALDGDDDLAERWLAADLAVVLGACSGVPITADDVVSAMTSRRGARSLAIRLGVRRRALRRWLRRGGSLPIVAVQHGEIMRTALAG